MPGREELIQRNREAIRTRVETAGDQSPSAGETIVNSGHRSLLGANLDVVSALESIEFAVKGPLGDGALRNSIAYIQYWNRGQSRALAENSSQSIDATQLDPGSDPQLQTAQQLSDAWYDGGDLPDDTFIQYSTSNPSAEAMDVSDWYTVSTGVERDEDGNIIRGAQQTVFSPVNTDRQKALAQEIPTVQSGLGTLSQNIVGASTLVDTGVDYTALTNAQGSRVGQLKPANPNGFVNAVSRIGRSIAGIPPAQIGYKGVLSESKGGRASVPKGALLTKGKWQFLFNPSELEIVAGPEFKAAETWGVSDKANSGQPLNWSHNKNAQLKFNSVLLNGYVFGRKVEELEQGIFELFMAREGGGQHGPPILEFVWGKRVFGPCVIKDISIKEKMWDEGQVVNAEMSFTLEQVPEWTINDGYVDVARPGRAPLVYDPTEENKDTTGTTAQPPTNTPPGGGTGAPDQKKQTTAQSADFVACKNLQQLELNAIAFNPVAGTYSISYSGGLIPGIGSGAVQGAYQSNFQRNYANYNSFVAKGNSLGVSTSAKCLPAAIKKEHEFLTKNANDSLKEVADKRMAPFMNTCAEELGKKAKNFYNQKGCKRFQTNVNSNTERL